MSGKDFRNLEKLVKAKLLNDKVFAEVSSANGGQIHGMSLPSFLHMALLEKVSVTLEVKIGAAVGFLYLRDGELIGAETGRLTGQKAAYEIISWEKSAIELRDASDRKKNEIKKSLVAILTEALELRKKRGEKTVSAAATSGPVDDRYRELRKGQRPEKNNFVPILLAAVLAMLILCVGAVFGLRILKARQVENEYTQVLAQVEEIDDPQTKIELLYDFIDNHEEGDHSRAAEDMINKINAAVEKRDFERIVKQVEQLPIDEHYAQAATEIYSSFLEQYPESEYSNKIESKILKIPDLIDNVDFKKVQKAAQLDYENRIATYLDYLVKHPTGRHRSKVEALIADMSQEYYSYLDKEIPRCNQQKNWDRCLVLCENFLNYFKNHHLAYEIEDLKAVMEDKKNVAALMKRVRLLGNQPAEAKKLLTSYLEENPGTTQAGRIKATLSKIQRNLSINREWQTALSSSQDTQNSLQNRISQLNRYILQNPSSPNIKEAKTILAQHQQEYRAQYAQRVAAERSQQQAVIEKEKKRLRMEQNKVITQIKKAGGRYKVNGNGTFIDQKTGRMWCLLDSYTILNKCQNYNAAKKYVEELTAGGHNDWRLPFGNELAEIYKTEPFFPGNSAAWYWTSEVFVKGYHRKALVVTSNREYGLRKIQKLLDDCGAVRAVRP
jgi:DNA-binding ferritin-like protein (Dps family)